MTEKKNQPHQQPRQPEHGGKGSMTVEEAGRMGGAKGGQRERELVERGHEVEQRREGQGEAPKHGGGGHKAGH